MDWSNESVLEFIELLEREPCIWNPKNKNHKVRHLLNEAWIRLASKLSLPCSIEELKKKRNILLTQYRECLKKIKEKAEFGAEKIYKPSWFAFDAIHKYMGAIYDCHPTISNKSQESAHESPLSQEAVSMEYLEFPSSPKSLKRSLSRESDIRSESDSFSITKRQRDAQDFTISQPQMDEAFSLTRNRCNREENEKEAHVCDLYGQLLAQKMKTLEVDDRLVLMNEIDNVVYRYIMNVRKRRNLVKTEHSPRMNQTQVVVDHHLIDLSRSSVLIQPSVSPRK